MRRNRSNSSIAPMSVAPKRRRIGPQHSLLLIPVLLFATLLIAAKPAGACQLEGVWHKQWYGCGGGGVDMYGLAFQAGQLLGEAIGNAINAQQNAVLARAVALNNEGVKYDNQGNNYVNARDYQRAIASHKRAIEFFRQSLSQEPGNEIAQKNLANANAHLLGDQSMIAFYAGNLEQALNLDRQMLRYSPGDKMILKNIANVEQLLAAQRQARQPQTPDVPPQKNIQAASNSPTRDQLQGIARKGVDSGRCFDGATDCTGTASTRLTPVGSPPAPPIPATPPPVGKSVSMSVAPSNQTISPGTFRSVPIALSNLPTNDNGVKVPLEPFRWPNSSTPPSQTDLAPGTFVSVPIAPSSLTEDLQPSTTPTFPPSRDWDKAAYCKDLENQISQMNDAAKRASLAQDAYYFYDNNVTQGWQEANWTAPPGFTLVNDIGELREMLPGMSASSIQDLLAPDNSSYRAAIYRDNDHNIFLAFRGTDAHLEDALRYGGKEDWPQNIGNAALGRWVDHFNKAVKLGYALKQYADKNGHQLEIVGHSLGGGMAIAAGLMAHAKTTVFNAETVALGAMPREGDIRKQLRDMGLKLDDVIMPPYVKPDVDDLGALADDLVVDYTTPREPLTLAQSLFLRPAPGRHVLLSDWPGSPVEASIDRHVMHSVRLAIANQIRLLTKDDTDNGCAQVLTLR